MQAAERPYLSIGEVLDLLLAEFPEVTISKIRFLESKALINPERTMAGYRKFYDEDIERLRVILREQKENFLPLKVIRERLESGEIDDTGGITPPRGIRASVQPGSDETGEMVAPDPDDVPTRHHPAASRSESSASTTDAPVASPASPPALSVVRSVPDPRDRYEVAEVLAASGLSPAQLRDLESFGLLAARSGSTVYTASEVDIAAACAGFMAAGVEARHLRAWRQAADREASLFEQMVMPLLRQRNPHARQQAATTIAELSERSAVLRAALLAETLRQHLEP